MDYREAVAFLFGLGKFAPTPGMMRMLPLLEALGNPHVELKVLHVAGTNGKGSTCAFLDSVLRSAGLRTGLFTSPHLQTVRERMRVDGRFIPEEDFARIASDVIDLSGEVQLGTGEHPTFFEILAAIMYRWAADRGVEWLVQEVGLGGRYDATNVVPRPVATTITDVDLDHTEVLGSTLSEIAGEKAGIIKPEIPVVVGPMNREAFDVVHRIARERGAPLSRLDASNAGTEPPLFGLLEVSEAGSRFSYRGPRWDFPDLHISMLGAHQIRNAALAVATLEAAGASLDVVHDAVPTGVASARWPGRVEPVSACPIVILDGAHNPSGARVLAESLRDIFEGRRIHAVVGIMGDKDARAMLEALSSRIDGWVATTRAPLPRAASETTLACLARDVLPRAMGVTAYQEPDDAVDAVLSRADPEDVVVIWGSLYLVGDLRGRWMPSEAI